METFFGLETFSLEEDAMRVTHVFWGLALAVAPALAATAGAQDSIYIPLLTYRTGPFASSGIPIADGMHDYLTMLNERDGGIAGVRLNVEECETGYDTRKGLECYEAARAKKPAIMTPGSAGTTLQLIPRASVERIPILSVGFGLPAAAVGSAFPWVFNPPATYWDGLSVILKYIGSKEGGLDRLKGKTIGFIYFVSGYGREPLPLLEQLAADYGFTVKMYPVKAQEMQGQSTQWQAVRRDRPAWTIMWGWGAMNAAAVKEAAKTGYPMDHLISAWWGSGEDDARPAGAGAKGYLALNFAAVGPDFAALQDIQKYVVDRGQSEVAAKDKVGESHYNKGVYNSVLIAEAIRNAQRLSGSKIVSGEEVRRGLETLDISAARWARLGLPGFSAPVKVTCADHSGHHAAYLQQWDGNKWVKVSDWVTPMADRVQPMLEAAAADYVSKDPAWPKRTEACDKGS
jgi:branched-chain amino acid transport system substrate-binding protein